MIVCMMFFMMVFVMASMAACMMDYDDLSMMIYIRWLYGQVFCCCLFGLLQETHLALAIPSEANKSVASRGLLRSQFQPALGQRSEVVLN